MSEPMLKKLPDPRTLSETARRLLAAHDREVAAHAGEPTPPVEKDQAA